MNQKILQIADKFFESASNGKDPWRATDGITTSLVVLKKGRELGRYRLLADLEKKGIGEKERSEMLEKLGI